MLFTKKLRVFFNKESEAKHLLGMSMHGTRTTQGL